MISISPLPRNAEYFLRPIRVSTVLRPNFAGARLPLTRKGDHWALDVDVGSLDPEGARALLADVLRAAGETVRLTLPQPRDDGSPPGEPVVDGAGQAGSNLALAGFAPAFVIRKGDPLTLVTGGQGYLYIATAETMAAADGRAVVPIWPMLRAPPAAGDPVEVVEPWIEGFIDEGGGATTNLLPAITPEKFTIEERA